MRLSWVAALVAVVAGAAGCGSAEEAAPSPTTTPSTSSPVPTALPTSPSAGSDGLTVRYRDDAGALKTVRVEDFPR